MRRLACLFAALLFSLVLAASASAQSTGGSFGGSDWGGSSGSSGGSYGSSGGGWGPSTPQGNGVEYSAPVQLAIVVGWVIAVYLLYRLWRAFLGRVSSEGRPIDVTMVQLALDARARRFVQETLGKLARGGETASSEGRAALLRATVNALSASKLAWIYAGARHVAPMPPAQAQAEFKRLADTARSTFQHELVRAADGAIASAAAPAIVARESEGEGTVLVTLIVAARKTLGDARAIDAAVLEGLLGELAKLTGAELVALEVVWTPAAESDRMSSAELEAKVPGLTRLASGVGRVFCSYCGGPHAAELASCPHCGAPGAPAQA